MEYARLLTCALNIGEQMLVSGAEVYRVEDCIRRIGLSYGAANVEAFALTSSLVVTIEGPDGSYWTQTRRVRGADTNLDRVDKLNQLSREMCRDHMDYPEFNRRFREIMSMPRYPQWVDGMAYAAIAGAFTVFFGGNWADALVSAVLGVVVKLAVWATGYASTNKVLANLVSSFLVSVLAFLAVNWGLGNAPDLIIIGNIMLLIPGIGLTNSIRDMISGDTVTGLIRFSEACILALAIAGGYLLAGTLMGGVI
jgi:uncharacterized membrane protein YjjP (DUF1212 family)